MLLLVFKQTGIWPFNHDIILKNKSVMAIGKTFQNESNELGVQTTLINDETPKRNEENSLENILKRFEKTSTQVARNLSNSVMTFFQRDTTKKTNNARTRLDTRFAKVLTSDEIRQQFLEIQENKQIQQEQQAVKKALSLKNKNLK